MNRIAYYAQNEETDQNGEYTNNPEAERKVLKELGAPDIETMEILSIEPEDRDEAIVEANVSDTLAEWLNLHASVLD